MQTLEQIGFYTLSDDRAKHVSATTPLWRCELILTDRCNFKCPYCRGIADPNKGNMSWEHASFVVRMWGAHHLKNVRFSGGEPTMWHVKDIHGNKRSLVDLVALAKEVGIQRVAISTNGSIKTEFYDRLIDAGVDDFSISLDSCCAETGDKMAGEKHGAWERVVNNIRHIAARTYVTVGIVFTPDNVAEFKKLVEFADTLGVADIRILSSAQWNQAFFDVQFDQAMLDRHPILKYRIGHLKGNRHVRGLTATDSQQCPLMLDDMVILGKHHYPCVINMREFGDPVGEIDFTVSPEDAIRKIRSERKQWALRNTHENPICVKNCLDVCIDYNNRVRTTNADWTD